MKEKVSISDINIPNNFKDIKTNYTITLYDKDTGEIVYSTEGHNKINPNIGLRPWANTYGAMLVSYVPMNAINNEKYEVPTGVYFHNTPDDPSTNHPAGPQRGEFVGGGQINVSDSSARRCSYNPSESKYEIVFEDGVAYKHNHIVYDATTSQLNGEINTVVIGSKRYLETSGIFYSDIPIKSSVAYDGTVESYMKPRFDKNASIMSYHPDRPAWQISQVSDANIRGTWSFDSDNTAWFAPFNTSGIASVDDIVLLHYDLVTWKVLGTVKLSLPEEAIGRELIAFKFNDCIAVYPRRTTSYNEDSSGVPQISTANSYIFNLNGDYVKTIGRALNDISFYRMVAIDGMLYYFPYKKNNTNFAMIVYSPELVRQDGIRMQDYYQDSRFGASSSYGQYSYLIRPFILLDNITGDRRLIFAGAANKNTAYYGDTNLSWNITTGQVEWLPKNSIYKLCYTYNGWTGASGLPCAINGIPYSLPAEGGSSGYWPFLWHHWCKLPSPVTKTANTTMKIQIDLYYPIVSPFTFLAPPDTEASTTETE